MFTNGLGRAVLGTTGATFRRAMARHAAHAQLGMGMILEARGNVYGDNGSVAGATVKARRAKNKRARQARAMHRRAAR